MILLILLAFDCSMICSLKDVCAFGVCGNLDNFDWKSLHSSGADSVVTIVVPYVLYVCGKIHRF